MNTQGFIIMLASITVVGSFFGWCLYKVLMQPEEEVEQLGAADLHTPDMDED
jgi:hypothetical protein